MDTTKLLLKPIFYHFKDYFCNTRHTDTIFTAINFFRSKLCSEVAKERRKRGNIFLFEPKKKTKMKEDRIKQICQD